MTEAREIPLMERFVRAMIQGALRRGHAIETVFKAVEVPISYPVNPAEVPPTRKALATFRRDVENAKLSHPVPDLDRPLDIKPALFFAMQRNIKWLVGDDFYGLTEQPCKVGTYLFMIEIAMNFHTLGDALGKAIRYYRVASDDIRFSLNRSEQFAEIRIELDKPELDPLHFLTEWQLLLWHRFASWLVGEAIPLTHAEFAYPMQSPLEDYQRMFTRNCMFERKASLIRFHARYLDKYNVRRTGEFKDFMDNRYDLAYIPGVDSALAVRLEARLEHYFNETLGFFSMEDAASESNMSSQTLRRRLEEEGTSFRQIKDNIRRKVAMHWLRDPSVPIAEVARLSGFADPNGLSRAVKSWTGKSPSEFRADETGED